MSQEKWAIRRPGGNAGWRIAVRQQDRVLWLQPSLVIIVKAKLAGMAVAELQVPKVGVCSFISARDYIDLVDKDLEPMLQQLAESEQAIIS